MAPDAVLARHIITNSGGHMVSNWEAPLPDISNLEGTRVLYSSSVVAALFFGVCVCPSAPAALRVLSTLVVLATEM